ncbi:MAG: type II toxin-antitoxin system PrlF family antitoxin [Pseudomonadota bacterium]
MGATANARKFFESEDPLSTLTDRYQTTVPTAVRKKLDLRKGDRIQYRIREDGVLLQKAVPDADGDDPVLEPFLAFIARDIQEQPGRLRGIDAKLIARARELTAGIIVDRNAPLDPADE